LPAVPLLLVDTGTTIPYNVDVTPERNKDEFVVVVVLEAFSGDQSIQSSEREEKRRWDGAHRVSYMTSWPASLLSSEFQSSSFSVQSTGSPFVAPYPRRTAAHSDDRRPTFFSPFSSPDARCVTLQTDYGLQYRCTLPSAPPVNAHGWLGWNTTSHTPSPLLLFVWPFRILTGTIMGLVMRSLKTFPWNT